MNKKKDDIIYYDVSYYNDKSTNQKATIFENRSNPIIKNPSKYQLSVVRFTIPTQYLPIFIWKNISGTNNPDNAYYSVTINGSQQFLQFVSNSGLTATDPNYLFIYSYQHFLDAINAALKLAFVATGGAATAPPYMIYDSKNELFALVTQYAYATVANYQIYFNDKLFSFFDNFNVKRLGNGLALGKDFQFNINNNGDNDFIGHPPTYARAGALDSYIFYQETKAAYLWNTSRNLILTTNGIPISEEGVNYRTNNTSTQQSSNSSYRKILTDFDLPLTENVRSYIQYVPQGEYRMISMYGDSSVYTFDMSIFFETEDLTVHQLYIPPGESFNVKIMFRAIY